AVQATMSGPLPAEEIRVHLVTGEFFNLLGVPALYGRTLTPIDATEPADTPPAVLSYFFWQRRFASDPQVIGRTITIRGHAFAIVGVMPRQFNGISADTSPDVRIPYRYGAWLAPEPVAANFSLELAARLRPGIGLTKAEAESRAIWMTAIQEQSQG